MCVQCKGLCLFSTVLFLVFASFRPWWSFLYSIAWRYFSSCCVLQKQLFRTWRCWNSLSWILRTDYTKLTCSEQYFIQSVCTTKVPENMNATECGTTGAEISQMIKMFSWHFMLADKYTDTIQNFIDTGSLYHLLPNKIYLRKSIPASEQ